MGANKKKEAVKDKALQKWRAGATLNERALGPGEQARREKRETMAKYLRYLSFAFMLYALMGWLSNPETVRFFNQYMVTGFIILFFTRWLKYADDPRMKIFRIKAQRRKEEARRREADPAEQLAAKTPRPCVLCGKTFVGFGTLAAPLAEGVCCDECRPRVWKAQADEACDVHKHGPLGTLAREKGFM